MQSELCGSTCTIFFILLPSYFNCMGTGDEGHTLLLYVRGLPEPDSIMAFGHVTNRTMIPGAVSNVCANTVIFSPHSMAGHVFNKHIRQRAYSSNIAYICKGCLHALRRQQIPDSLLKRSSKATICARHKWYLLNCTRHFLCV